MTKLLKILPLFLAALLLGGCIENGMMVEVNPDGSGTLTVKLLTASALEGMGAEGMEAAGSTGEELKDASQFGEGVELIEIKEMTNTSGWKGHLATYSFENIEDLHLQQTDTGDAAESPMGNNQKISYRFDFEPGSPATLKIIPELNGEDATELAGEPEAVSAEDDPFSEAGLSPSEAAPALGGGMADMQTQMMTAMMASMGPMLKGMRVSYLIKVNGEILETNAKYQPKPGTIVVMDMKVDQLLSDPDNLSKLNGGIKAITELANSDNPALQMQDPSEPLVIQFQ